MASRDDTLVSEIREAFGNDVVDALSRAFGSRILYWPARIPSEDHPIARAVGFDVAVRITEEVFAPMGGFVMFPLGRYGHMYRRGQDVDAALLAGRTMSFITREFGMSRRGVSYRRRRLVLAGRLSRVTPGRPPVPTSEA